jgi:hypothetical protein
MCKQLKERVGAQTYLLRKCVFFTGNPSGKKSGQCKLYLKGRIFNKKHNSPPVRKLYQKHHRKTSKIIAIKMQKSYIKQGFILDFFAEFVILITCFQRASIKFEKNQTFSLTIKTKKPTVNTRKNETIGFFN